MPTESIDIENPGSSEAELQSALRTLVVGSDIMGYVPLQKTVISAPVQQVDFALPADRLHFRLLMLDVEFGQNDYPSFVFSPDNGATFHNDTENYNSYYYEILHNWGDAPTFDVSVNNNGPLAKPAISRLHSVIIEIFPGSAADRAAVEFHTMGVDSSTLRFGNRGYVWLEFAYGRQNLIRFAPNTNFDLAGGTPREIVSGTFLLTAI